MILELLAASTPLLPPTEPAPEALPGSGPSILITVEETRLSLENRALEAALLVVGDEGEQARAFQWLPGGALLETSFARGALQGLCLELLHPLPGGWGTSGAIALPRASAGERIHVWLFESGVTLCAREGDPITPLPGAPSLLAGSRLPGLRSLRPGGGASLPAVAPPLHVPVPEPSGRPEAGTPPKLEERPLPAV